MRYVGKLQLVLIGLSGCICSESAEIVALIQQILDILRLVGDVIFYLFFIFLKSLSANWAWWFCNFWETVGP